MCRQITPENPRSPSALSTPRCLLSCATESLGCAPGEIIVLRVAGEVDLCTLPTLQTALDHGLDQYPAHLVVDLAQMTFCCIGGLGLLTRTRHTAARNATSYTVSGVRPHIDRLWTRLWDGDLPVRCRSTAVALTAIWSGQRALADDP